jgi:hypothetical protein
MLVCQSTAGEYSAWFMALDCQEWARPDVRWAGAVGAHTHMNMIHCTMLQCSSMSLLGAVALPVALEQEQLLLYTPPHVTACAAAGWW